MLTNKELLQLEDFLGMQQSNVKTLQHFANEVNCQQTKQLLQQMAQQCQQQEQTISRHLQAGQTMQS